MTPPASANSYQTPQADLLARLNEHRPPRPAPDFGLRHFLGERFRNNLFARSHFHHPERDFSEWQQQTRAYLKDELVIPGALAKPSEPTLLDRREFAHYTIEEIEFSVTPPLRAAATVVIPRNHQPMHPAIVALHSMGALRTHGREKLFRTKNEPAYLSKYRETYYAGRSLQLELARAGFLSIAIDAFNFGTRTPKAHEGRADFEEWRQQCSEDEASQFSVEIGQIGEAQVARLLGTLGVSPAALIATDDLRTVDYLTSRDDVDPSRIGCCGLSFGSFRANYLSALDPRVRAAASACWISTLEGIIDYNPLGAMGFFALPPRVYSQMDLTDIIALAAPKPFLALSGWHDPMMQPSGLAKAHLHLRQAWCASRAPENLGSLVYNVAHTFSLPMQEAALSFLSKHLTAQPMG